MLKTMRDSFHHLKWTLFAVIIVFILGFVYFSGTNTGSSDASGQVVARIGGDSISAAEFDRRYRSELDRQQAQYQGKLSPELIRALDMPRQVLDSMIDRVLRLEAARRLSLKVSDEEVAAAVISFPELQENGHFIGNEKYERFLRANGYTPERFEEDVREGLLLQKYSTLVKASVLVPDKDLQREFSNRNDKASIEYVKIPAGKLETVAPASDADLKSYLEKHKDRYQTAAQRRTKYLVVDRGRVHAQIKIPDPELKADYDRRKASFQMPEQVAASHILIKVDPDKGPAADAAAKQKAEALFARASKGEDFAKLANENTDDPSGKGSGGQLAPFGRGQMVPEFEQAAFDMKPGEIRGPIKTQFGYHIIKVLSKLPAHIRSFEEVKGQILAELSETRSQAETDRVARELADKIKQLKNPTDDDLRKLQSDVVTYNETPWAAKGDPIPGIGANARFSEEAWSLKLGQISTTPITTTRGPAFVKPTEERPAGVPPLDEIKARVTADFQADRRDREAIGKLQPVVQELSSGTTLAAVAARYETEVKTTPDFGPGGPIPEIGNAPELSAAIFQTGKGQVGPPVPAAGGFVLFRVVNRVSADSKIFETQKPEILDTLQAREAERLLRAELQRMRADRKIQVNEELLKTFLPEQNAPRRG
ncbi:MAG TPA: peptidyl-prolyl cis-trans isomerase [Thermoanaerobaculia bacterium]|nr:peptidyl-prolyl cis-trans isomerase [Thermoanaerobaculia bacterium]